MAVRTLLLTVSAAALAVACAPGRSVPTARPAVSAPAEWPARPRVTVRAARVPARLAQLHVRCRDFDDDCTGGVGMLARIEGADVQRCTVVLIGPDRVLTASHCLPPSARRAGARCESSWIAFPTVGAARGGWTGCEEVVSAETVDDEAVMRSDVAVLRLRRALEERPIVEVDASAPAEGSVVTVVGVAPHPIYPTQHEIGARHCRVASTESAVETFGDDAARVGWLMDCPSRGGTSGAPVLDGEGRLRALLHGGSAPRHGIAVTSGLDRPYL